jgi:hypothetical protein
MPGKIANTLKGPDLVRMLEELHALSAEPTLAQVQEIAKKYGVGVSLMGARTFRDSTFKAHLERLAQGREKSAQILSAVREGGAHPLDAVEEAAAADLLDAYTSGEEVDVGQVVKVALQLRASMEQRKDRDRNDADLKRKIADSEAARENSQRRTEVLEERLKVVQLDAAKAALKHVKDLRGIAADTSLGDAEKLERARLRLFGNAPEGLQTLAQMHAQKKTA